MGDEEHVFCGQLASSPLAEMLATIHRRGVPGVLQISRDDASASVYFDGGDVVFATSSECGESLADCLVRKGRITTAQQQVATRELERSTGVRLGEVLIQMGYIGADELAATVREQVQQVLRELFNWDDGEVLFRVGRLRERGVYEVKMSTPRVIMIGCRQIAEGRQVTERLGGRQTVLQRPEWPLHVGSFPLEAGEQQLLDLVDGKRTLYQLCEEGPMGHGLNARVLYALWVLGIVDRERENAGHIKIQLSSPQE
jgi:polyhydroxyalkanoate synthesis regulator phasin